MSNPAAHPLNDFSLPSGGVILKSSDGVEFKVYKNILALASPFFRQMFSLPQPDHASDMPAADTASEVQVIDMSESSSTLDFLLRLIYPIEPPRFPGISEAGVVVDGKALVAEISSLLAAALKYEMHLVVKHLCTKLLDAAETTRPDGSVLDDTLALRVFGLACRHRLKEEARRAAHVSLKGRVAGVFIEYLRQLSAAQYFHLIQFHDRVVSVVDSIVQKDDTSISRLTGIRCDSCGTSGIYNSGPGFAAWWQYLVVQAHPVLHQSPKSDAVFRGDTLKQIFLRASWCRRLDCQQLPARWDVISQEIKEFIDTAIAQNDIDLSEI